MDNFTPEDLILYLYNEVPDNKKLDIETALSLNWPLQEKMAVLKASMQRLSTIVETPRTEVIMNIMNHARQNHRSEETLSCQ